MMRRDAYKRTLQFAKTRAIVQDYRQKRREKRRLIKRWKREKEIEMYRNDAQKFFKNVKRLTKEAIY